MNKSINVKHIFTLIYSLNLIVLILSLIVPTYKTSVSDFDLKQNQKHVEIQPHESISQSFEAKYNNINSIDLMLFNIAQDSSESKVRVEVKNVKSETIVTEELYWSQSTNNKPFHIELTSQNSIKGDLFTIVVTAINDPLTIFVSTPSSEEDGEVNDEFSLMMQVNYRNKDYSTVWFPLLFLAITFSFQTFYLRGTTSESENK